MILAGGAKQGTASSHVGLSTELSPVLLLLFLDNVLPVCDLPCLSQDRLSLKWVETRQLQPTIRRRKLKRNDCLLRPPERAPKLHLGAPATPESHPSLPRLQGALPHLSTFTVLADQAWLG